MFNKTWIAGLIAIWLSAFFWADLCWSQGQTKFGNDRHEWIDVDGQTLLTGIVTSYDKQTDQATLEDSETSINQTVRLRDLSAKDRARLRKLIKQKLIGDYDALAGDSLVDKAVPAVGSSLENRAAGIPAKWAPTESGNRFGLNWESGVAAALAKAAGGSRVDDDRPVFCFRVLGDLQGFM